MLTFKMCEGRAYLVSGASEEGKCCSQAATWSWQTKVTNKRLQKQAHYIETCCYMRLFSPPIFRFNTIKINCLHSIQVQYVILPSASFAHHSALLPCHTHRLNEFQETQPSSLPYMKLEQSVMYLTLIKQYWNLGCDFWDALYHFWPVTIMVEETAMPYCDFLQDFAWLVGQYWEPLKLVDHWLLISTLLLKTTELQPSAMYIISSKLCYPAHMGTAVCRVHTSAGCIITGTLTETQYTLPLLFLHGCLPRQHIRLVGEGLQVHSSAVTNATMCEGRMQECCCLENYHAASGHISTLFLRQFYKNGKFSLKIFASTMRIQLAWIAGYLWIYSSWMAGFNVPHSHLYLENGDTKTVTYFL
jgi:hypothetical protein